MIYKRVAIGALARNCEENLPDNIERIEKLRKKFSDSAVFVYENNSTDSTRNILHKWSSTSNCVFVKSEDIDESPYKSSKKVGRLYRGTEVGRIRKMCDCRNKLLDMIRHKGPFDYVIFIDIDIAWFSIDGVVSAIQNAPEGWGGLFANCYVIYQHNGKQKVSPQYYDTFAYFAMGSKIDDMEMRALNIFNKFRLASILYKNANDTAYLECGSAFGGVGVYRYNSINSLSYEIYKPERWSEVEVCPCEHIYFNHKIKESKFIAKEIIVCYDYFNVSKVRWNIVKRMPRLYNFIAMLKGICN